LHSRYKLSLYLISLLFPVSVDVFSTFPGELRGVNASNLELTEVGRWAQLWLKFWEPELKLEFWLTLSLAGCITGLWFTKIKMGFSLYRKEKVTAFRTIFEVNSIIGEVWDFMAQFDNKYWENYTFDRYSASELRV